MTIEISDSSLIHLSLAPEAASVHVEGQLDALAVAQLAETLKLIPTGTSRILLRLAATQVGPGAMILLRHSLMRHRAGLDSGCSLAVWADEPLLRAAVPAALLQPPTDATGGDGLNTYPGNS